jgi:hypothetical protein
MQKATTEDQITTGCSKYDRCKQNQERHVPLDWILSMSCRDAGVSQRVGISWQPVHHVTTRVMIGRL